MLRVKVLLVLFCAGHRKVFLLPNSVQQVNKMSSGLCPHGCAQGACPICSGMGGGSMRMGERPQKAGEMSYHQCAMIGAMMKARAAQEAEHEQNLLRHAEAVAKFEQNMINAAQKLAEFSNRISQNILLKPAAFLINKLAIPVLNLIKNIPNVMLNAANKFIQIKEKFADIQDKLNAIFGEAKNFVEKKVSELVSNIKAKLETLFKIFKRNNTKDDETKIDEDKKIFNLKTFIQKIRKKKDDTEDKSRP